jgi:hypothetical protein
MGYIVWNKVNGPLQLLKSEGNTLWSNGEATVFKTKKAAQKAIDNTREYAEKNGYVGSRYPAWEATPYISKLKKG